MKNLFIVFMAMGLVACTLPTSSDTVPSETTEQTETETTKYQDFSAEKLALANGEQAVVLFFHAKWCSWCRARERQILNMMDTLPENTVIFKVNFDTEEALRAEYGVKTKDEFVFINADGTFTNKAGASVDTIVQFFTEGTVSETADKIDGKAGYMEYDPAVVATFIGKNPYAFDFYADWCSSCRSSEKDIIENLDFFPANTVVFKVDYDSNKDLRDQYGVKSQHTIVFFDKDGNAVETIQGFDNDDIVKHFLK